MFGGAVSVPVDVIARLTKLVELVDDSRWLLGAVRDQVAKEALGDVLTTVDETLVSILAVHDTNNEWGQ
tara:strand:+ start:256 stop:462 length:207 start_codon:yes stop_codon:yes gene_type:complete